MKKQILDNEIAYFDEEGKKPAFVFFEKQEGFLIITKTFVDSSLRGQGYAKRLMEDVLSYARENSLRLKATCSFALSYFEKNPSDLFLK